MHYVLSAARVLFVVGGQDNVRTLSSVELVGLDGTPTPSCDVADFPYPIKEGVMAVSKGAPIFCGGIDDSFLSRSDCHMYDKETNSWVPVAPMSAPRKGHSMVQVNDHDFFIVGKLGRISRLRSITTLLHSI